MSKSTHYRNEEAISAFGRKVRELRESKGVTIEEFANSHDLHVTFLSRIERGKMNVTISSIALLADKFGIEMAEFFT